MIGELIRAAVSSLFGAMGFGILVHAPVKSWIPGSLTAMAAFLVYWAALQLGMPDPAAIFCGSMFGALAALYCSKRLKMIGTTFLMMSIVSFVPGLGLYRCMEYLGAGQTRLGAEQGVAAMITIAMIVLGQSTGSFLYRSVTSLRKGRKKA